MINSINVGMDKIYGFLKVFVSWNIRQLTCELI
jgi:hypothetical protein